MKEPELEFGGIYTGKIVEIRSNGVLIQLYPTMSPVLLPNSQLDRRKVTKNKKSILIDLIFI
jgi:polyribonucleotide nucleotidyltransferase